MNDLDFLPRLLKCPNRSFFQVLPDAPRFDRRDASLHFLL
jgi:hypothetical protein